MRRLDPESYLGLALLGIVGRLAGTALTWSMFAHPDVFNPIVETIVRLRFHAHYSPAYYRGIVWFVGFLTLLWVVFMAYALVKKPVTDRRVERYVMQLEEQSSRPIVMRLAKEPSSMRKPPDP